MVIASVIPYPETVVGVDDIFDHATLVNHDGFAYAPDVYTPFVTVAALPEHDAAVVALVALVALVAVAALPEHDAEVVALATVPVILVPAKEVIHAGSA